MTKKKDFAKKNKNSRFAKKLYFLAIIFFISINIIHAAEEKSSMSLKLRWDEDKIVNGKEFWIEIEALNLEDKNYDIKVFIYDENDKIISQTYDNENRKWISSNNYVKMFFIGSEDKSEEIKLRIKKDLLNFSGDAGIGIRIRENGGSSYKEEKEDIYVYEFKNITKKNPEALESDETGKDYSKTMISEESVKLESNGKTEGIKTQNYIVYESKNESIKKYSVYFFAFLCVILIILLMLRIV